MWDFREKKRKNDKGRFDFFFWAFVYHFWLLVDFFFSILLDTFFNAGENNSFQPLVDIQILFLFLFFFFFFLYSPRLLFTTRIASLWRQLLRRSPEVTPGQQLHDVIAGRWSEPRLVRNAPKPTPAPALLSSAFETLPSGLSLICARAVSSLPSSSSPFSKFASRYKTNKQDRMSENTFKLARQPLQPSNFSRLLFLAAHCDARLSDEEMAGMKVEFSRQIMSLSSRWLSLPLTLAGWAWLSFHNSGKGAKNKRIRLMDN